MHLHLSALAAIAFVGPPSPTTPDQVKAAVVRSLPLLEKGAVGHVEHRQCFACHNQALPLLALYAAKGQGFAVNEKELQRQLRFTVNSLDRNREKYQKGEGQGGQADTAGYALFTLDVGD